ncbi:restriction endonuclease subunit S [Faecalibacterium sp. Marseille-P9590]|uniref:restriction endonuclease subunit S n=1 Tax=Faecalibacterium sp. Marseille-P9590 TaxID=2817017 RepID=UPI001A9B7071|nr:restriction endonuclease subunit S [Faecalibacterium sp. Marseille-P9590]MBO1292322.1 restriction endonuclease subunit S [Faecalibacterium sp. Marseille-P9590]
MTGQQLKNSILQMAVQGKLVPQDPNDEPASVLLERIRAEKEQLIKEGKIKKEKNPSVIFRGADNLPYEKVGKNEPVCIADEVPFDIPESWEWVRLGEIFQHNTGKALNSSNKSGVLLEYITTSNLYWDRFELENLRSMYFTENEIEKCQVSKGDLLVCEGGDIGRAAIWLKDYKICIQNHIHRLRSYVPLCTRFYYYVFFLYKYAGWIGGKGIGIQGLSSNALHSLLVPVPPIAEQERIVKRLEIIKPLSDKYSEASEQIQELNNLFPEHLKKSILQYAVQGKLVPQDPADEPASVLLERIRTEKEKLIKAGRIKRDKHESVIFRRDNSYYEKVDGIERCIDDELPFEIPDSWEWTTIGTTCINIQYGSSRKSESTGTMAVLRMGNIQNGRIDTQKLVYTSDKEEIAHYPLEYNDLLFNRTNSKELVGKTAIYKSEVPAIYAGYLIRITPLIDSDYLNYVMQTQFYWVYCQNVRSDAIGQSNINAEKLKNFIYPLPPLHEQKRIAKKLNSIFTKIK